MKNHQEKNAFLASLTDVPGFTSAIFAFNGSIEEYFDHDPASLLWCIRYGLMDTPWAHIATPARVNKAAKIQPLWALNWAAHLLTPDRRAWCIKKTAKR